VVEIRWAQLFELWLVQLRSGRDGDNDLAVLFENLPHVDQRDAAESIVFIESEDVALGGLFSVPRLRLAHAQIEHVAISVVLDAVEDPFADDQRVHIRSAFLGPFLSA